MLKTLADIPGKFNLGRDVYSSRKERQRKLQNRFSWRQKLLVVHTDRMKKFQGHASPEATAPTVKPKTRKRARFSEKNQLSLVDII